MPQAKTHQHAAPQLGEILSASSLGPAENGDDHRHPCACRAGQPDRDVAHRAARLFPSVRRLPNVSTIRMAFAGETPARPIAPRLNDLAQRRE